MTARQPTAIEELASDKRGVNPQTLDLVLRLAVEIAREGREGRKIGTLFVVGDTERVRRSARPLILDPLKGHPDAVKHLSDPDMRETVKELAQLDGAFLVRDDGVVESAAQYINASASDVSLPLGLGARHVAAAAITRHTNAVAVVVSESSVVRLFDDGELISEIIPELWMLSRYASHLHGPGTRQRQEGKVTVVRKVD